MNTRTMADEIVAALTARLRDDLCDGGLPAFRSVYLCGSYCRGDWLNSASDLDLHEILREGCEADRARDERQLRAVVADALGGRTLPSHCPGGVEFGFSDETYLPKTREEACKPSPYAYFSTLMFDFKAHHRTLYGDEIGDLLPEAPDPKACALGWLRMLNERMQTLVDGDFRLTFNAYKAVQAVQLHFGEVTVNKYRMLELYQRHVPEFPEKWLGELLIRNYLGSFYPGRPPMALPDSEIRQFTDALAAVVGG